MDLSYLISLLVHVEGRTTDNLLIPALVVVEAHEASTDLLQKRLSLDHTEASRLIEDLEKYRIVSAPHNGTRRDVLVSSAIEAVLQLKIQRDIYR